MMVVVCIYSCLGNGELLCLPGREQVPGHDLEVTLTELENF